MIFGHLIYVCLLIVYSIYSMSPNILVGVVEGSSQFRRWYYEAEIEHIEQMTKTPPYLRIGWANNVGYKPFPGSGDG